MAKRVATALLVLGVLAGSYYLYGWQTQRSSAAKAAAVASDVRTEQVIRGSLEALVSATGRVAAERTQSLTFGASGTVSEVLVAEGDRVAQGQILAVLDARDLQFSLEQAEAALRVAKAQQAQALESASAEQLAVLQAGIEATKAGVRTAEAGVAAARANRARLSAGPTADEVSIAGHRVEQAKNALWGAQTQRDAICGRVQFGLSEAECENAKASVQGAEEAVRIAELQLKQLQAGPRSAEISAAQAQLDQALGQLEAARAQQAQAEAELARVSRGPSAAYAALLQAQVDQAQVGVDIARARLNDINLVAPAAGVLAKWTPKVGDRVTAGASVGTLMNDSLPYVAVDVDETEIAAVRVGQRARVMLDALPGKVFDGTVSLIAASGASAQGIVSFEVRVLLSTEVAEARPPMTATVDIVTASKDDALLVPNRALRRERSVTYVQVRDGAAVVRVDVTTGIAGASYTEVLSGLSEGQEVVVSRPQERLFSMSAFGGG